jgi:hypothetical protein
MANSQPLSTRGSHVNFEDLKEAYPLREVLRREFGISVRQGQSLIPCPFHDDHKPSFSIYKRGRKELFKCHSPGCAKPGSVLDLVWETHPDLRGKAAATLAHLSGNYANAAAPFLERPRDR